MQLVKRYASALPRQMRHPEVCGEFLSLEILILYLGLYIYSYIWAVYLFLGIKTALDHQKNSFGHLDTFLKLTDFRENNGT